MTTGTTVIKVAHLPMIGQTVYYAQNHMMQQSAGLVNSVVFEKQCSSEHLSEKGYTTNNLEVSYVDTIKCFS